MRYIKHIHCFNCHRLVPAKGLLMPRVGWCNRCCQAEMDRLLAEEALLMLYARITGMIR